MRARLKSPDTSAARAAGNTTGDHFTIQPWLGVTMALGAVLAGVGMDVLAKIAALDASPAQVTMLRWGYGVATLIPTMLLLRIAPGSPWQWIHLWRLILNSIGSFCLYYALAHLPLSVVVAIFFLEPIVALGLASLFLGEPLSRLSMAGSALALAGIFMMTGIAEWRFDARADIAVLGVAMLGALAWGALLAITRAKGRGTPVLGLMFWQGLFTTIGMAPLAWHDWRPLDAGAHLAMFGVAVCGTVYGVLFITVLRRAPIRIVTGCSFLGLPLAFLAGFLFFEEIPGLIAVIGALLVIAGVWLALNLPRRQRAKRGNAGAPTPDSASVAGLESP